MKKRIKIQGALIFIQIILLLLFGKFVVPDWGKEPLEEFFDTLGIILVLFGFLLRIVARGYKEEMSNRGNNLVIDGPYCLMRNPMYFGSLMIGTGIIAILFKLWTLPVFLVVYLFIYLPQVSKEEKTLLARFGEEYKNYCGTTPKYFPNIRRVLEPKNHISLLRPSWFKKELGRLIAIIIAVFIIEIWQDVRLFGLKELLDEFLELLLVVSILAATVAVLGYGQWPKQSA